MTTTTIRVAEATRDRLNALARRRGATAGELVAELVRAADDDALLADAVESWDRLAGDRERRAAYRDETDRLEAFGVPLPPD